MRVLSGILFLTVILDVLHAVASRPLHVVQLILTLTLFGLALRRAWPI